MLKFLYEIIKSYKFSSASADFQFQVYILTITMYNNALNWPFQPKSFVLKYKTRTITEGDEYPRSAALTINGSNEKLSI